MFIVITCNVGFGDLPKDARAPAAPRTDQQAGVPAVGLGALKARSEFAQRLILNGGQLRAD